jgi:hypothetical protein
LEASKWWYDFMNLNNSDKKNWLRGLATMATRGAEVELLVRLLAKVVIAILDGRVLGIILQLWEVLVVQVIMRDRTGGGEVVEVIIMYVLYSMPIVEVLTSC